jgi:hypothetical protein
LIKNQNLENFSNDIGFSCIVFILAIKAVHLFTIQPIDNPEIYSREEYSQEIARVLDQKNIDEVNLRAKSNYWKYFYLRKSGLTIELFKNSSKKTSITVLSMDPSLSTFRKIDKITYPNHKPTFVYRNNDESGSL